MRAMLSQYVDEFRITLIYPPEWIPTLSRASALEAQHLRTRRTRICDKKSAGDEIDEVDDRDSLIQW
jgi:hypothetical protein